MLHQYFRLVHAEEITDRLHFARQRAGLAVQTAVELLPIDIKPTTNLGN